MTDRPNILFVFPDQLSARWVPCYGNKVVHAPVLSRFAAQNTQFSRAYTNAPLCTPYRSCLLTGKYASQTGVRRNAMRLPENMPTIADHLNEAGYDTHYIGKWHLSGKPNGNRWVPPDLRGGFRNFIGWESHHIDHNAGLIWYDDPAEPTELRGHETDGLTDIVCEEIESLKSSPSPFLMMVAYQAPHPPCAPPQIDMNRYDSSVLDEPPTTDPNAWFKYEQWNADYGVEEFRKRYFAEISHIDAAFGRILDALEEAKLADNTVVIFTSDHGEMAGSHSLFGKNVMFDESVRVPLLVRVPGAPARTVDDPVCTVDLFSSILDLAGVPPPSDDQGRSIIPLLQGEEISGRDIYIEDKTDCIIRNDLKAVTDRNGTKIEQCFDVQADPYEMTNLAESLDQETTASLLSSLKQWREQVRSNPGN